MATFNGASDAGSIRRIAANAKRTCDDLTRTYNGGHSDNADGIKHELAEVLRTLCNCGRTSRTGYFGPFVPQPSNRAEDGQPYVQRVEGDRPYHVRGSP